MVDFQKPAVIEKDFVAVVNFWHFLNGLFIWEFIVTLDFEWSVIRGHRPYRWTIWIYSLTRAFTLIAIILNMVGFDSSIPINCQLWVIFECISAYLAFAGASFLVVLRISAIWDRNRIAVAIAMCAWSTGVASQIHTIVQIHATWVPAQSVCEVPNTETTKPTIIAVFVSDVTLLLTMLVGLLRLRQHGAMLAFGQFLWRQGLIWLFLATVAGAPPAVFIGLNLNEPLNLMFLTPALIVMSIAATRMHRSLTEFAYPSSQALDIDLTRRERMANAYLKRIFAVPIPLNRVVVASHRSSEDNPPVNIGQYGQYSADGQS